MKKFLTATLFFLILCSCSLMDHYNPDIYDLRRVSKIPFGLKVSPEDSPVNSDRFYGYHTALDYEIFTFENDLEIPVTALCSGPIVVKRFAGGYGGVIVQKCNINNSAVTIVYGHLNLDSIKYKIEDFIEKDQVIGILGKGFSDETDGERKHLHLGIHKGSEINILGYVQNESELINWIDPSKCYNQNNLNLNLCLKN